MGILVLLWLSLAIAGLGGIAFERRRDFIGALFIVAACLCQVPAYGAFLAP